MGEPEVIASDNARVGRQRDSKGCPIMPPHEHLERTAIVGTYAAHKLGVRDLLVPERQLSDRVAVMGHAIHVEDTR
jgi:hypothetical protein